MALTGNSRFHKSLLGKVVLQVEEDVKPFWSRSETGKLKRRWRNATAMDLSTPEMRQLNEMRFSPYRHFLSSRVSGTVPAHPMPAGAPGEITTPPLPSSEARPTADPATVTPA